MYTDYQITDTFEDTIDKILKHPNTKGLESYAIRSEFDEKLESIVSKYKERVKTISKRDSKIVFKNGSILLFVKFERYKTEYPFYKRRKLNTEKIQSISFHFMANNLARFTEYSIRLRGYIKVSES